MSKNENYSKKDQMSALEELCCSKPKSLLRNGGLNSGTKTEGRKEGKDARAQTPLPQTNPTSPQPSQTSKSKSQNPSKTQNTKKN